MKGKGGTNVSAAVLSTHIIIFFLKVKWGGGGCRPIPPSFPGFDASEVMETFLFSSKTGAHGIKTVSENNEPN